MLELWTENQQDGRMRARTVQQQVLRGNGVEAIADSARRKGVVSRADPQRGSDNNDMSVAARRDFFADSSSLLAILYAIADLIAVGVAGYVAHFLAFEKFQLPSSYRIAVVLSLLLMLTVSSWAGMYTSWRGRSYLDHARRATLVWFSVLVT